MNKKINSKKDMWVGTHVGCTCSNHTCCSSPWWKYSRSLWVGPAREDPPPGRRGANASECPEPRTCLAGVGGTALYNNTHCLTHYLPLTCIPSPITNFPLLTWPWLKKNMVKVCRERMLKLWKRDTSWFVKTVRRWNVYKEKRRWGDFQVHIGKMCWERMFAL